MSNQHIVDALTGLLKERIDEVTQIQATINILNGSKGLFTKVTVKPEALLHRQGVGKSIRELIVQFGETKPQGFTSTEAIKYCTPFIKAEKEQISSRVHSTINNLKNRDIVIAEGDGFRKIYKLNLEN